MPYPGWLATIHEWLMALEPANVLAAFTAGAGVFALSLGLRQRPSINLREIDRVYTGGERDLTLVERLQVRLNDARLNVTAREFVWVCLLLSVAGGGVLYLLSGIPVAAFFGALFGGAGYWFYLQRKAARNVAVYEDELPQVVARLISGAQAGNTFQAAVEYVARFGPEVCREDWRYIAEQLRLNVAPEQVFKSLSERRRSILLNLVLELLLLAVKEGAALSETLPAIQKSLEERQRLVRQARTEFGGPLRDMLIVAATPFLVVIGFALINPVYGELYSSPVGQVAVAIGWTVDVIAVFYALRYFDGELRKITDFQARLKPSDTRRNLRESAATAAPARPTAAWIPPSARAGPGGSGERP